MKYSAFHRKFCRISVLSLLTAINRFPPSRPPPLSSPPPPLPPQASGLEGGAVQIKGCGQALIAPYRSSTLKFSSNIASERKKGYASLPYIYLIGGTLDSLLSGDSRKVA